MQEVDTAVAGVEVKVAEEAYATAAEEFVDIERME